VAVGLAAACAVAAATTPPQELRPTPIQTTPGQPAQRVQTGPPGQKVLPTWNGLVLWSVSLATAPSAPPAIDTTQMYAPLRDGTLVAINHRTGKTVWTVTRTVSTTPVALDGMVVGIDGSKVWALDAATGQERWAQVLEGTVNQPPSGDAGHIAVATDRQEIVLLNAATGSVTWHRALGSQPTAPPVILGTTVFAGVEDGRVFAISIAAGSTTWTRKLNGKVLSLTALPDRLLAGGTDDYFHSLDLNSGAVQWQWRVGGDVASPAIADATRVYVVAMDNMLRALDRKRGNMAWQRPLTSRPMGGPLLLGGFVVLAHVAPELRCFDTVTGTPACVVGLPGRALHRPFLPTLGTTSMPRLVYLSGGGQAIAVGPSPEPLLEKWLKVPGTQLPPEVAPISPLPVKGKRSWPEPDLVPLTYAPGSLRPHEWDPVAPLPVPGRRSWPEPDLVRWTAIPGRVLPPERLPVIRPPR
jgi:outer membrane protein assembly factor BamB